MTEEVKQKTVYTASSPDELALVNGAAYLGHKLKSRSEEGSLVVNENGKDVEYTVKRVIEFNSDRKMMSILVHDGSKYLLLSKGADNKVFAKLKDTPENKAAIDTCNEKLTEFAKIGLRTLVYAQKTLSKEEYERFQSDLEEARKEGEDAIDKLHSKIEEDLDFVGATAIEDMLQDDLENILVQFREIGIKFWMLTGDHPVTAVSIANSCKLIDDSYQVFELSKPNEAEKELETLMPKVQQSKCCVVVTGDVLCRFEVGSYELNAVKA